MRIAVASGKGGTGKTTLSVSLALSYHGSATLLDCDVEEPNAALFLSGEDERTVPVTVPIPVIAEALCTHCGACARSCEFNAIVHIGTTVMVFPELCHSCGGCALACPASAIREVDSPIGEMAEMTVSRGAGTEPLILIQGLLSIGKAMSPPVIRAVKKRGEEIARALTVIDCPPGTSCPMGTAVAEADFVILVTEPTPFGLHDLDIAVRTVRKMGLQFGVVINRSDSGDDRVVRYCASEGIDVLLSIPQDMRIARAYSEGRPLVDSSPEYREILSGLIEKVIAQGGAR